MQGTAGGADDEERGPIRTCIVTRAGRPPEEMIRFVLAPDGSVTPDIKHRLPGRGVWVTASAEVVAQAVKRRAFDRGFRGKAVVSDDLPGQIDRLLEADCLQRLSLANKAGLVTPGFAKVEAAIVEGGVTSVLHATDGGQDGKRKIGQALRRRAPSFCVSAGDTVSPERMAPGLRVVPSALALRVTATRPAGLSMKWRIRSNTRSGMPWIRK